ncbi:MAG: pyridoxal phosphate-dependent aminotransferase [bacterium]|nr:pyridoxal phosphate-dependent aminotransferase [bacterium]
MTEPGALDYRPDPRGLHEAREAVASYYADRGTTLSPDQIVLTASTSEAYSFLFKLLTDPGDEVLTPQPSYPLFDFLVGMEALAGRHYRLTYDDGWRIDFDQLRGQLGGRTRVVVAVSPNNPTGSYVKCHEFDSLLEVCADNGVSLITDEVFHDYGLTDSAVQSSSIGSRDGPLRFTLSGLSKVVGLPQMKLSWIVVSGADCQAAIERLELIADTYLSVSTPVQHAASKLLELRDGFQLEVLSRLRLNLRELRAQVRDTPCRPLEVEGGWYAILGIPTTLDEERLVLDLLDEDDTLVQPGYFYDFPGNGYLILSLLPEPSVFREGVGRLVRRLSRHL